MKSEQTHDQWLDAFLASEESLEPIPPQFHEKLMRKLEEPVVSPTPFLPPSLVRLAFGLGLFIIMISVGAYYAWPYLEQLTVASPSLSLPSSLWKNLSYLIGCGFILIAFKEWLDRKIWTTSA